MSTTGPALPHADDHGTAGPAPQVTLGPWLMRAPRADLLTHRATRGRLVTPALPDLLALVEDADVRGRGGAGFPLARKLATVASSDRRRHVVVDLAEGEPASHKDRALALHQPHLVLDGAAIAAVALGVRRVDVVLGGGRPDAAAGIQRALAERAGHDREAGLAWVVHTTADRFVAGESSAVLELVQGRPGLPVTSWVPAARSGVRGRPTLLANAETFAHLAALVLHGREEHARLGTPTEPGTTLLTLGGDDGTRPRVAEVPHGTPWRTVLADDDLRRPVLLGGYHGTWARPRALEDLRVSRRELAEHGLTLGAGVVLPLAPGTCPLQRTAELVRYLASESAGRCGPCFNGLPALATAVEERVAGLDRPADQRVEGLVGLVDGRGACAHPDGTARLVRSMLTAFPEELAFHADGRCRAAGVPVGAR